MPRIPRNTWSHVWPFAVAIVLVWVLAAHVFVAFPRFRTKLVTRPVAATPRIALPLGAAARMPGDALVLVYRARTAAASVTVTARLGDRVLVATRIPAGARRRVDLAIPRSMARSAGESIELSGSAPWTLEYVELANLHGFTRGAVEFLILPASQPFEAPGFPWVMSFGACALAAASVRLPRMPRWPRLAHAAVAAAVAALFLLAVVSPWVTPYRVVFAVHTFVLGAAALALPRALHVLGAAGRSHAVAALARRAAALPWRTLGMGVAAAAYVVLLWSHMGALAGGSDSSGYLNSARLLAELRVSTAAPRVTGVPDTMLPRAAFVPLGFRPHGSAAIAPTYPIGLPLALVAAASVFGWQHAPGIVMLLHAVLGVALTAWLASVCGLERRAALLAAVMLATSPLYLFMSVQLMSDVPALVWTTMAVVLACAASSRAQPRLEVLVGLAASMAVLVRPTNILVLVPIAICLGLSWRRWLRIAAGGLPAAALLAAYNLAAYGSAMTTGYGDMSYRFASGNVLPSVRHYVTWLPVLLTPLGVLALGLPALVRRGRAVVMLLAWAGCYVVLYAFYYHTHEWWWYLRFLLPAFPPLLVGALWAGAAAWRRWGAGAFAARLTPALALGLTIVLVLHNAYWARRLEALEIGRRETVYSEAAAWATANLPPQAAVLTAQASGAFFYYTTFALVRWDRCDRETLRRLERATLVRGTPLYAVFFPFELDEQRAFDRIPGQWARVGRVRHVTIWRLEGE